MSDLVLLRCPALAHTVHSCSALYHPCLSLALKATEFYRRQVEKPTNAYHNSLRPCEIPYCGGCCVGVGALTLDLYLANASRPVPGALTATYSHDF